MMRAFTLIEILVVIGILTMMTSFLVLYNKTGEARIHLLEDKTKVINAILQAKNLALGSLIQNTTADTVCGYGIHFEKSYYFLYQDMASDCLLSDRRYSADNPEELFTNTNVAALNPEINFFNLEIHDILFVPPIPNVFFDGSSAIGNKKIILSDEDEMIKSEITINNAGQISEK